MKTIRLLVAMLVNVVLTTDLGAQCASSLQYITYDTTVTGGGNSIYNLSFPKFSAPSGTLLEVQIRSEITLSYGFELENTAASAVTGYRVRVDRNDQIVSDALITPIDTTFPRKTYGPFSLTSTDGVAGSGTDYYREPENYILNHSVLQRTIYNTADYLGAGTVDFEYSSNSFTISPTSPPTFATASDTITVSVTYVICPTFFLASDVSVFNVRKKDGETADITWTTHNETEGRKYVLEVSTDGKNFNYVQDFKAFPKENQTGHYFFQYKNNGAEKLIFRLKQVERNGSAKYSPLRIVDFPKISALQPHIYPNPSNGQLNIVFNRHKKSDWVVDIFSINGQLLQHYNFKNTVLAKVDLSGKLPRGTYVLKAIHKRSQEQTVHKIIVR